MAVKSNPVGVKLGRGALRRFNMAREWMHVNRWNYYNAQSLAQDAGRKYDVAVKDLLPAAQKLFAQQKNGHAGGISNPLFTRSEKKRTRKKIVHKIKGVARGAFSRLFGIPLSPGLGGSGRRDGAQHRLRRSGGPSVRQDVVSALTNQGYKRRDAEQMAAKVQPGDSFSDAFRRVMARNPGELVIFGNPAHVFTRMGVIRAKRAGNPIPAALLTGFEGALGSVAAQELMERPRKSGHRVIGSSGHRRTGRPGGRASRKKKNPSSIERATKLFRRFHHRSESGVFESQRSARIRKDYTILGPLVAIGTNAEKYDQFKRDFIAARGKAAWYGDAHQDGFAVEHWDQLPHQAFLTGAQVASVKRILSEPDKYVGDCPQLASSPNGKQLYALVPDGVDPDFLRQYDVDPSKDYIDLGEATFVVYIAKKPVEATEWVHTLGEHAPAGSAVERPRLLYARLPRELLFVGGSYYVDAPGIMN